MRAVERNLFSTLVLLASWTAFGAGGGPSMPSTPPTSQSRETPSPEEQARESYDSGVRSVAKGDECLAEAAQQRDARKQQKLRARAAKAYETALRKFARATELRPGMFAAWNYLGYCHRKQGRYGEALAAYDRALALKPDYAEAIEYRGHAYLGLNRLADAKSAYLTLFAMNRRLAASLLAAMQAWAGAHEDVGFAAWVQERSVIDRQTAALTRESSATSWN